MADNKIIVSEINFSKLKDYDDSTSAVLTGIDFENGFNFKEVDDFLSNELGFSKGKNLTGVYRIMGNVLGADGRKDWLLTFDNPSKQFNYLARLRFDGLKWTSDFVDNYAHQYNL